MTDPGAVLRRNVYGRAWRCACPKAAPLVGNLVPGRCPHCRTVPLSVGTGVRVEEAPLPPEQAARVGQQQVRHG